MADLKISRRDFLNTAAAGTVGVAVMGVMSSCAPQTVSTESSPSGATASSNSIVSTIDEATVKVGKTMDTDVVIVGAGAAGLMAGMNLARAGRKVIIVEKGPTPAIANFANCGGPTAAETRLQADENATVTVDQMFTHMYNFSRSAVDAALLRNCIANTGQAINDMLDLGIGMTLIPDTYGVGFRGRHMFAAGGMDRVQPIIDDIIAKGGQVLTSTAGAKVIMKDGKAAGIFAKTETEVIQINAQAVLICTGGFQENVEMLEKHFGVKNINSLGNNLSAGDGIEMALAAGGRLDRNFVAPGNEGSGTNHKVPEGPYTSDWDLTNYNLAFGIYGSLLVNPNGDRFMNEKMIADYPLALGGEAYARAGRAYAILDAAYYDACCTVGIFEYLGKPADWVSGAALWYPNTAKAREQLDLAISQGWAFKSDNLAECAKHFNLPNLEATVQKYNEMCDAGADTEYGKSAAFMKKIGDGPYYVFEYEPAIWCTQGGVRIDQHCRVLDIDSMPISGLYVGGVDNGSVYCAPYYDNEGASVGLAIGSGVLAGKEIHAYLG